MGLRTRHSRSKVYGSLMIAKSHHLLSPPPFSEHPCIYKFSIQNLLCNLLQRDGYYELCHDSVTFPCRFKKTTRTSAPKPISSVITPRVEVFDYLPASLNSNDVRDYVKLPSRDRTESEPLPFSDSRIQAVKEPDNPTVRGVE